MTLLIILAVIKGYVAIPWWAWLAAWLHATWQGFSFYVVARQEIAKRVMAKRGEAFLKNMLDELGKPRPGQDPPPTMYMGPKNTVN